MEIAAIISAIASVVAVGVSIWAAKLSRDNELKINLVRGDVENLAVQIAKIEINRNKNAINNVITDGGLHM